MLRAGSRAKRRAQRAAFHNEASKQTRAKQAPLDVRLMHPLAGNPFATVDVFAWSACSILDVEMLSNMPHDVSPTEKAKCWTRVKAGSKPIDRRAPNWYNTIKTDATDRTSRMRAQLSERKSRMIGESK